jgi:hypothetical protein
MISKYQRAFKIKHLFRSDMFHTVFPVRTQKIKAKAIHFWNYFVNEALSQQSPLSRVNVAFENRKLNALAKILAGSGHAPKPLLTVFAHGNIVTHKNHHGVYLQKKGG